MFVVFDIGTSRLKASAFSGTGELLGHTAKRHSQHAEDGYAWQDTSEWWRNACSGFANLMRGSGLHPKDIRGISVSGRAGAGIFVDGNGQVLAEPWSDGRHRPLLEVLRDEHRLRLGRSALVDGAERTQNAALVTGPRRRRG